jgi:hypothetical protein
VEEEVDQEQFRLKVKEILAQVDRLDSAKDDRGAIAALTQGIELAEVFLREHPEAAAGFASMLPELYHLRAFHRHRLSQAAGTPDKKDVLGAARKDIDKALSFPDSYYTRDKAYLKKLQELIKKDSGGCFIATAAYGSAAMPEVALLRQFRDAHLKPRRSGRLIICTYEWWSPPLAAWIAGRPAARLWVRRLVLSPMVRIARHWTSS